MQLWQTKIRIGYSILASAVSLCLGMFLGSMLVSKDSQKFSGQEAPLADHDPNIGPETRNRRARHRPDENAPGFSSDQTNRENFLRKWNVVEVGAPYSLLDNNLKVNPYALEMAGVPENKSDKIQQMIDRAWGQLAVLARGQLSPNPAESNEAEKRFAYDVKPFGSEAKAILDDLNKDFAKEFGTQSTGLLFSALHPERYFGNAGKSPMRLIIEPKRNQGAMSITNSKTEYTLNIIDPFSGDVTTMMKSDDISIFDKALGKNSGKALGR